MKNPLEDFFYSNPKIHHTAFIAEGAKIMGDVRIGAESSVWYNCVLRGDVHYVSVGDRTNIQDGSILHVEHDIPCIVGKDVVVGHGANIHGCTIEDACLIGMGAIVLSGCVVKTGSIIAAGAVLKEGTVMDSPGLWGGVPARKIRDLGPETGEKNRKAASDYVLLARMHKKKYG